MQRLILAFVLFAVLPACQTARRPVYEPVGPLPHSQPTAPTPPSPAGTEALEQLWAHGTMNLRAAPNTSAEILGEVQRGAALLVGPEDASGWARVLQGGPEGSWVWRRSSLLLYQKPGQGPPAGLGVPIATCNDGSWAFAPRHETTCGDRGGIFRWWSEYPSYERDRRRFEKNH